ncbi:hypothetical protein Bca101_100239 [Brassica carinata]
MSDLGEKILTRVGSTWEGITKSWVVLGKKAADEFLVGFVKMNNKYITAMGWCYAWLRTSRSWWCGTLTCVNQGGSDREEKASRQADIYAIGYSEDKNKKRDHKILRFVDDYSVAGSVKSVFRCEIFEMSSSDSSWRVLEEAKPKWEKDVHQRGASVNGNTYFFAHDRCDDIEPDPS